MLRLSKVLDVSKFSFEKTKYKSRDEEITITCKTHGDITKQANTFLMGYGCYKCNNKLMSTQEYINKLEALYPNELEFHKTNYTGATDPIVVTCKVHGDVVKDKANYMYVSKCNLCSIEKTSKLLTKDPKIFIEDMKKLYPNNFNYNETNYTKSHEEVTVICKVHNKVITKLAYTMLVNNPCSSCNPKSKLENEFKEFISSFNLDCFTIKPTWLNGKELDIYIPDLNLAIEINGSIYHHSTNNTNSFIDNFYKDSNYHLDKYLKCKDNNIDLIHIFEFENLDEWKDILIKYIKNKNKYSISFTNLHRNIKTNNMVLDYYGKSEINLNEKTNT